MRCATSEKIVRAATQVAKREEIFTNANVRAAPSITYRLYQAAEVTSSPVSCGLKAGPAILGDCT